MSDFTQTMLLTCKLATITTLILLIIGIPIGYYLAYTKSRVKPFLEATISMPLVLPPSVLGFYFLIFFSPNNSFGKFLEKYFDLRLVFTFEGVVLASIIFSLPFMIHPIQNGFSSLSKNLQEASWVLGKNKIETFFYVLLPNIKSSLLTGSILSFAHTIGEFGVVLMMGGSIEGKTRVASIAIYEEVDALNYGTANKYALTLFLFSFFILLFIYLINKRFIKAN